MKDKVLITVSWHCVHENYSYEIFRGNFGACVRNFFRTKFFRVTVEKDFMFWQKAGRTILINLISFWCREIRLDWYTKLHVNLMAFSKNWSKYSLNLVVSCLQNRVEVLFLNFTKRTDGSYHRLIKIKWKGENQI